MRKRLEAVRKGERRSSRRRKPEAEEQIESGKAQLETLEDQISEDEQPSLGRCRRRSTQLEQAAIGRCAEQEVRRHAPRTPVPETDSAEAGTPGAAAGLQKQLDPAEDAGRGGLNQKIAAEKERVYARRRRQLDGGRKRTDRRRERAGLFTEKTLNCHREKAGSRPGRRYGSGQKQIDDAWAELAESEQETGRRRRRDRGEREKAGGRQKEEYKQGKREAEEGDRRRRERNSS